MPDSCRRLAGGFGRLLVRLREHRIQLVDEPDPGALEPLTTVAVGLVGDCRAEHPVADPVPVELGLETRLQLGALFLLPPRQVPEIAFAGEAPELGRAALPEV